MIRVIDPGLGASIQDRGRTGWRRFGVPAGGCMDPEAMVCANRLLENGSSAPVIELLLEGAKFEMLADCWVAICGAEVECSIPVRRAYLAAKGEIIRIKRCRSGMWSCLAVAGGIAVGRFFGASDNDQFAVL